MALAHKIGIEMKWKELTRTFMMIPNWKITCGLHGLYKNILEL